MTGAAAEVASELPEEDVYSFPGSSAMSALSSLSPVPAPMPRQGPSSLSSYTKSQLIQQNLQLRSMVAALTNCFAAQLDVSATQHKENQKKAAENAELKKCLNDWQVKFERAQRRGFPIQLDPSHSVQKECNDGDGQGSSTLQSAERKLKKSADRGNSPSKRKVERKPKKDKKESCKEDGAEETPETKVPLEKGQDQEFSEKPVSGKRRKGLEENTEERDMQKKSKLGEEVNEAKSMKKNGDFLANRDSFNGAAEVTFGGTRGRLRSDIGAEILKGLPGRRCPKQSPPRRGVLGGPVLGEPAENVVTTDKHPYYSVYFDQNNPIRNMFWSRIVGQKEKANDKGCGAGSKKLLQVPQWREKSLSPGYSMEGTEHLDESAYSKRHKKPEEEEKRRKRWDLQRLREEQALQKLREGRNYKRQMASTMPSKSDVINDNPNDVTSLWPQNVKECVVQNALEVSVWGLNVSSSLMDEQQDVVPPCLRGMTVQKANKLIAAQKQKNSTK